MGANMWERVVLDKDLGRAFLKLAIREGFLKIITANTAEEDKQIKQYLSEYNRSRADEESLSYGLLAQTIAVPGIGNAQVCLHSYCHGIPENQPHREDRDA